MQEDTKEMKKKVIKIEGISDIKYEEPKEFKNSVMREVYEKAFNITKEIVKNNEKICSGNGKGTLIRNREQKSNIIFFTGERGAGKTSAMLSYMEFLKDYYRNFYNDKEKNILEDLTFDKDYMFTGIEYIDASSLDMKEDILGSVLSKMLKKWNDEEKRSHSGRGILRVNDYEFKKRQIRMQFNKVYECLKDLRSDKDIMQVDSDMFMETLERLTLSMNVREAFQKLVEDYLDIMVYPDSESSIGINNHFLVISIDELDMNIKHGFMLLEQIRKYLMVRNVIVLLSANYEQLEKICYNHYTIEFNNIKTEEGNKEYIRQLSYEYLEKIVPTQRQVKLVTGQLWDFFNKKEITIEYGTDKDETSGEIVKLEKTGNLCQIIRNDMNSYFNTKFASDSRAILYLTPNTLREICSWINQTRGLKKIEENQNLAIIYEENIKRFWLEEFPRVCKRNLSVSNLRDFEMLNFMEAYGKIRFVKERLEQKLEINSDSILELLSKAQEADKEIQQYASMAIIYFTMELSEALVNLRQYNLQKILTKKEDKTKERILKEQLLKYYINGNRGIWGAWEKRMLGPILKDTANNLFIYIGRNRFASDNGCFNLTFESTDEALRQESLINYQYLLLFYTCDNEQELIWDEKDSTVKPTQVCKGVFSLSGFVINLLEENNLVSSFNNKYIKKKCMENGKFQKGKYNKLSILQNEEVRNAMEEPLLPIDNVEFLIYLGKKIQERFESSSVEFSEVNQGGIKKKIKEFFRIIINILGEYDKLYTTDYCERFSKFPVVDNIITGKKNFLELLDYSIQSHVEPTKED